DLDAQGGGRQGQGQACVAAPHPAVQGGVRRQFGDEEAGRGRALVVVGLRPAPPVRQPPLGGVARGVRAARRGGEHGAEVGGAHRRFIRCGDDFLFHLTEGDRVALPWGALGAVRRVTVPVRTVCRTGVRPCPGGILAGSSPVHGAIRVGGGAA